MRGQVKGDGGAEAGWGELWDVCVVEMKREGDGRSRDRVMFGVCGDDGADREGSA